VVVLFWTKVEQKIEEKGENFNKLLYVGF